MGAKGKTSFPSCAAGAAAPSLQLIVFDLDGTLVDSRRDLAESTNALLVLCGAEPLPEPTIGRMVGEGAAALVARAFAAAGLPQPPDALDRFLAIYNLRLLDHTRPYVRIPEVLAALSGRVPLAVLTNKPRAATSKILEGLSLDRYFTPERVISGDGPFPRKPHPKALQHLAERAGTSSEATMLVGDSAIDWRTARNAAARLCIARYGFGFEGFPVETLSADDCVIDAPWDLMGVCMDLGR